MTLNRLMLALPIGALVATVLVSNSASAQAATPPKPASHAGHGTADKE